MKKLHVYRVLTRHKQSLWTMDSAIHGVLISTASSHSYHFVYVRSVFSTEIRLSDSCHKY